MKNLVTFIQENFQRDVIGEEVRLDPNGINGEYFDDGDDMPSIGETYEIVKIYSDKEGNPISIDILEKRTGKVFEKYRISNFEFCNREMNRCLRRYLVQN